MVVDYGRIVGVNMVGGFIDYFGSLLMNVFDCFGL